MVPERVTQQSVGDILGEYVASRNCAPTCFYMLGRAGGYLDGGIGSTLEGFSDSLDWDSNFSEARGWVRPYMSADIRNKYGMDIVSWQLNGADKPDIERMKAAHYLDSEREVTFFQEHIAGKSLPQIVHNTYPVIVGVKPGFGGESKSTHAVILTEWTKGKVTVVDPDDRNTQQVYDEAYVEKYLNPKGGGCTIVLPKTA